MPREQRCVGGEAGGLSSFHHQRHFLRRAAEAVDGEHRGAVAVHAEGRGIPVASEVPPLSRISPHRA